jgi:hypothetical protein
MEGVLNLIKLKLATDPQFVSSVWTTGALTSFWLGGTVSFFRLFNHHMVCILGAERHLLLVPQPGRWRTCILEMAGCKCLIC